MKKAFFSFFMLIFFSFASAQESGGQSKASKVDATQPIEIRQLMLWLIDPAADAIWDSVATIMKEKETIQLAPKNDAEWENLRQQAMVISEAGNLLLMKERQRPGKIWTLAARKLQSSGRLALVASLKQDPELMFKAGEEIYKACAACHHSYTNFDKDPTEH